MLSLSDMIASGTRIPYASSTHSSHQAQVPNCVFPQVNTVTLLGSIDAVRKRTAK